MGYKRCLEANEFADFPLNKAKRFECDNELVSFADIEAPNSALMKPVISGKDVEGFYNIQWYDAFEPETVTEVPRVGKKDIETSGHFSSSSREDGFGSGGTSLSVSSDFLEFDFPQKSNVPLDDAYSALVSSPRRQVSVGPNHQATIPVWQGKMNKISLSTGTYNFDKPVPGLVSANNVDDNEENLMGTSIIPMPDLSFYSSCKRDVGEEGRTECNCLDPDSIRCVQQHVREARENLKKTLGIESFVNLGFCDMGEEVALKWSEEEEEVFREIVYMNPASSGRNFWKQLSAAFPSRTKKEIVSYYFNVFMLQRRAAQNRSRVLNIDSDDDESHPINNLGFYGFEVSDEDDSAIELLDNHVHVKYQDNLSEDDGDDDNSDNETNGNDIGMGGYDMANSTDTNSQIESCGDPVQQVDGTPGISKEDFGFQDDSCTSFEYQINMDESCQSVGPVDACPPLQASGFKCDQSPLLPGILDFSGESMEHVYFSEPCDAKDWYPGYSTGPASDIDFSTTSNLIEEFLGQVTPDRKNRND